MAATAMTPLRLQQTRGVASQRQLRPPPLSIPKNSDLRRANSERRQSRFPRGLSIKPLRLKSSRNDAIKTAGGRTGGIKRGGRFRSQGALPNQNDPDRSEKHLTRKQNQFGSKRKRIHKSSELDQPIAKFDYSNRRLDQTKRGKSRKSALRRISRANDELCCRLTSEWRSVAGSCVRRV